MIRRSTPTKDAVLNVLADSKKAMSQEAIMKKVDIDIDRATVYRVLNRFCEDGILHRIVAEDGKQYFAVCIKCEEKSLQIIIFISDVQTVKQ
jgi:Fur family ferric uptake transcriptional regulator